MRCVHKAGALYHSLKSALPWCGTIENHSSYEKSAAALSRHPHKTQHFFEFQRVDNGPGKIAYLTKPDTFQFSCGALDPPPTAIDAARRWE
jgi:hypothetical protein